MFLKKIACGKILRYKGEFNCATEFSGKTIKTKVFVMKKSSNLSGTGWMNQFNLWDLPISSYCNKINVLSSDAEILKKELKTLPRSFFWRSGEV